VSYSYYILAILVIGLFSLVAVRVATRSAPRTNRRHSARPGSLQAGAQPAARQAIGKSRKPKKSPPAGPHTRSIFARELQHIRTPWGWSRHRELNRSSDETTGGSFALRAFVNRLTRGKELARDPASDPRISGSLRALLEDRYGRVNRESMETIEYHTVKKPLLRDPNEPFDQMDDFDSREAERIRMKLKNVLSMGSEAGFTAKGERMRYVDIKDVKQPWGW